MEDWEKQLRRKKHFDSLIINRPEAMKDLRRRTEFSITTIGWIVWLFLCRPLFILLLWLIGFKFFYQHMVDLGGLVGLNELKYVYITCIVLILLLVRGWNVYNKIRYGKKTRRKFDGGVTHKSLEEYFELPDDAAIEIHKMSEIDVDFLDNHQINLKDTKSPSESFNGKFRST